MNESYTPERLLVAVARQDEDAFRTLYDCTSGKLFGITLRICRDRSLAEDALQETYSAVWRRARSFDPAKGSGLVWLAAIARNRAIDILRRRKTAGQVEASGRYLEPGSELPDLQSARLDYAELDALIRCLEELGNNQREAVLLAYYEGWSREELATRFDVPVNTLKTRLRRGLAKLRACLEV